MSNKIPSPPVYAAPKAKPKGWYRTTDRYGYPSPTNQPIVMNRETLVAAWALTHPNIHWSNLSFGELNHTIDLTGRHILEAMREPTAAQCGPHMKWVRALATNDQEVWNDAVSRGRNVIDNKSANSNAWVQSLIASGALSKPNRAP